MTIINQPGVITSENSLARQPRFEAVHVAYYYGALLVIGAMGWFMNSAWERFGGGGILAIALSYAVLFIMAGRRVLKFPALQIPGGLLYTMAVCMTPLVVYGIERMTGFWPEKDPGRYSQFHSVVNVGWIFMEIATIAAGCVAIRCCPFPFLMAPISFALWYLTMDVTSLLMGNQSWESRQWISLWFGLTMILGAFLIDRRSKADYAFWLYLFGTLAFWGGLSSMQGGSEFTRAMYCLINVALVILSVLLQRRVFIIFGTLGITAYLGHLSYSTFRNSIMFPFAITFLGILVIFLGVMFQRHRVAITQAILRVIPQVLRRRLPDQQKPVI